MNSLQLQITARTCWGEARGEGEAGIDAVAHVLWNRVKDGRWGSTLFDVCTARWQFSAWNLANPSEIAIWDSNVNMIPHQFASWDIQDPNRNLMLNLADNDPILEMCEEAVTWAATEDDPTQGATHYYANSIAPPSWTVGATRTVQIGHHIFYKNVK